MKNATQQETRKYWVWVTRPEYYLDDWGNDREDLDPTTNIDSDGSWTCHKNTKKGDFILLYRSAIKRDIGYLMQAESDAYFIGDDDYAVEQGWDYGCDYRVLYKFENPLTLQEMRANPYLQDWGAFRGNFQRKAYEIPTTHWQQLNNLLAENNKGYKNLLQILEETVVAKSILLEEELEDALVEDLSLLKPFGYDLELYEAKDGASGRQLVCKGNGGRIDLLCYDRTKKQYVVIELKNVRAGQNTFGQICNYIGWVQERIAINKAVIGLVISRGFDAKFQSSMKITDKIFHLNLEDIGFE
jgi:hypothetical protein